MAFQDKTLTCKECGKEFIFTAGEQEFYAEKGFENEPARCRDCRDKRRRSREGGEQRRCTRSSVQSAVKKRKFRSNRRTTARCTAAIASARERHSTERQSVEIFS